MSAPGPPGSAAPGPLNPPPGAPAPYEDKANGETTNGTTDAPPSMFHIDKSTESTMGGTLQDQSAPHDDTGLPIREHPASGPPYPKRRRMIHVQSLMNPVPISGRDIHRLGKMPLQLNDSGTVYNHSGAVDHSHGGQRGQGQGQLATGFQEMCRTFEWQISDTYRSLDECAFNCHRLLDELAGRTARKPGPDRTQNGYSDGRL